MSDIKEVQIGEDIFIIKDQNALPKAGGTMTGNLILNGGSVTVNGVTVPLTMKGVVNPGNTGTYQDIQCVGTDNNRVGGIRFQKGTDTNNITIYSTKYSTNTFVTAFSCQTNTSGKKTYTPVQLITTWVSGTEGYNIWSNGYCEQWGRFSQGGWAERTVTLKKKFANTNYNVTTSGAGYAANTDTWGMKSQAVGSFTVYGYNDTGWACWKACGILADDQY